MNQEGFQDMQENPPNLGGLHILVFDPDKAALTHTKSMLKQAFYTVISTGEQSLALKMLEDNAELIDLLMIDDSPREMDCPTFIRKIKAIKETIPIILLSSREVYLSASLIQIGACRIVSKPISAAEVKFLWKHANGWGIKACKKLQEAIGDKGKEATIGDKGKQVTPSSGKGKGKAVAIALVEDRRRKGKRVTGTPEKHDPKDDENGTGRKRCRTYTKELHRKCMEILERKTNDVFIISPTKQAVSTNSSGQFKDKAEKDGKSSSNHGLPRPIISEVRSKIQQPSRNLHFGLGRNPFLGSTIFSSTPVIRSTSQGIVLTPSGSSAPLSGKGIAINPSVHPSPKSPFGEKRTMMGNDLARFSKLVHTQSSVLALNGEFVRKRQLIESQFQAPPMPNVNPNSATSTTTIQLLPPSSNNNASWHAPDGNNNNISVGVAGVNQEGNALSGLRFGSPEVLLEPENFNNNVPNADQDYNNDVTIQWVESFLMPAEESNNPPSSEFNGINLEDFFNGVIMTPNGSTSSTPSSCVFQALEANADQPTGSRSNVENNMDQPTGSASNPESLTKKDDSATGSMNIDDPLWSWDHVD